LGLGAATAAGVELEAGTGAGVALGAGADGGVGIPAAAVRRAAVLAGNSLMMSETASGGI
jgi:hypothetical protein